MVEKSMVSAKIAERTKDRLDNHADREGISRSQMIDRMLKQGLDVEEGDVKVVPSDPVENDDSQDMVYANHMRLENIIQSVFTAGLTVLFLVGTGVI